MLTPEHIAARLKATQDLKNMQRMRTVTNVADVSSVTNVSSSCVIADSDFDDSLDGIPRSEERADLQLLMQDFSGKPIIHVLAGDADSCWLPTDAEITAHFAANEMELPDSYNAAYENLLVDRLFVSKMDLSAVIEGRAKLLTKIAGGVACTQEVMSFSARQTLAVDGNNALNKKNGYYVFVLPKIAKLLGVTCDPTVLADCTGIGTQMGDTHNNAHTKGVAAATKIAVEKECLSSNDKFKISNIYMLAHKKAQQHPGGLIVLDVFDDRMDILEKCYAFWAKKKHKAKLPAHVIVRFSKCESDQAVEYLTAIKGTGTVDLEFSATLRIMHTFARKHNKARLSSRSGEVDYAVILTDNDFFAKLPDILARRNSAAIGIQYGWWTYQARLQAQKSKLLANGVELQAAVSVDPYVGKVGTQLGAVALQTFDTELQPGGVEFQIASVGTQAVVAFQPTNVEPQIVGARSQSNIDASDESTVMQAILRSRENAAQARVLGSEVWASISDRPRASRMNRIC